MTDGQKKYALAYRAKLEALQVRDFARVQQEEEYMRKIRSSYRISHEDARRIQHEVEGKKTMNANPLHSRSPDEHKIKKGSRVTIQLPTWYDGTPVTGWPSPDYIGTVLRVENFTGVTTARVRYDTGRKSYETLDRLYLVEGKTMNANPDEPVPEMMSDGTGVGLLAVGVLALIGGVIYVATRPDAPGNDLPAPAKAPPSKPKCLDCAASTTTSNPTEVERFAKDTGYRVWCVEAQAVATWKPPLPAFASDPQARAYSQMDCSFYTWSAGAWVKDEIMNGELHAWRSKFIGTSGHPVAAFVVGA